MSKQLRIIEVYGLFLGGGVKHDMFYSDRDIHSYQQGCSQPRKIKNISEL